MEKDVFDYIDEDNDSEDVDLAENEKKQSALLWNVLTVVMLVVALCVGGVYLMIFINPNSGLNPFPPPALPEVAQLPSPTPTPKNLLPPTWTATVTLEPTITNTPEPSKTPENTPENLVVEDDGAPLPPQQELGDMPIVLHDGSPQYIPASSFHPDQGCDWLGVAGQVIDINGAPVQGLLIEVGGKLNGNVVGNPTILQATGLAKAYGEAGYEVQLAEEPLESNGTIWVQVIDQAGLPLSEKIYFYTFDSCEKNLVIIYFRQIQ